MRVCQGQAELITVKAPTQDELAGQHGTKEDVHCISTLYECYKSAYPWCRSSSPAPSITIGVLGRRPTVFNVRVDGDRGLH